MNLIHTKEDNANKILHAKAEGPTRRNTGQTTPTQGQDRQTKPTEKRHFIERFDRTNNL